MSGDNRRSASGHDAPPDVVRFLIAFSDPARITRAHRGDSHGWCVSCAGKRWPCDFFQWSELAGRLGSR